jgi:hypothetical protein
MHTISRPEHSETLTDGQPAGVEAFLETLREEQAHFLFALREASSLLGRDSGQLAQVAAIQSRLTQQFFDAQRQILTRRAEFDDEVAHITACDRAEPGPPSARHGIAALGVAVVRTKADADDLRCVIDDAFLPVDPDGVAPQQELALLLDHWWEAENRQGLALIDLARARAAMSSHVARIEAGEIAARALTTDGRSPASSVKTCIEPPQLVLPHSISDLLDEADSIDLETLLDRLAETLDPSLSGPESPAQQCPELPGERRARLVIDCPSTDVEFPDMTRDFWTEPSTIATARRTVRWGRSSAADSPRPGRHDRR